MLSRKKEAFRCYTQSMLSRKKEVSLVVATMRSITPSVDKVREKLRRIA
jgi:ribosomal protein S24E